MNRFKSSLAAKVSAIFLFVIMLIVAIVGAVGIIYMAYGNVYYDEGKSERENIINNYLYSEYYTAVDLYEDFLNEENYYGYDSFENKYNKENTNLSLRIEDEDGKKLFTNFRVVNPKFEIERSHIVILNKRYESKVEYFETYQERWSYLQECDEKYQELEYGTYDEDVNGDGDYECILEVSYITGDEKEIFVSACIGNELTAKDDLYYQLLWFDKLVELRYPAIIVTIIALIICIMTFIFLISSAGHKQGSEGVRLNWLDRIPFDLYTAVVAAAGVMAGILLSELYYYNSLAGFGLASIVFIVFLMLVLALVLSFATRAKCGAWWKNTVIYRCIRLIIKCIKLVFSAIPVMPKVIAGLVVMCTINLLIAVTYPEDVSLILWFLECCILVPGVIILVLQLKRLRKGVENIAEGDFDSQIDTKYLIPELRDCGKSINSINNVLSREVNERMKSERFKTELITNVSHDIKTPLTSIINYVDLIKKKDVSDRELCDYIEVLDRQSGRLKKLIEDLVECSKAQTGNITVNKSPVDLGVILSQTVGEYQEKLAANNLSLMIERPEEAVYVSADGRLLWRALDNLLNNACKYSLTGTRVYLSLIKTDREAVVIIKNISKEQLNVSSDELMERFVRGDSSRNTEGSGLGLSIAKSLIALQQAKMDIQIDGDLFKVIISYSLIGGEFVNP